MMRGDFQLDQNLGNKQQNFARLTLILDFISVDFVRVYDNAGYRDKNLDYYCIFRKQTGVLLDPVGLDLKGIGVIACVVRAGCVMIDWCATYSSACFCFCEVYGGATF